MWESDCVFGTHTFLWKQVESVKLSLKDFSVTQCPGTALDEAAIGGSVLVSYRYPQRCDTLWLAWGEIDLSGQRVCGSLYLLSWSLSGLQATDCFNKNIVAESTYVKKYFYCLNSQVSKSIKWLGLISALYYFHMLPLLKGKNRVSSRPLDKAGEENWLRNLCHLFQY